MPFITTYVDVNGEQEDMILPVNVYVRKRIERFVYNDKVRNVNAPIAYLESPALNSLRNVMITDMTYTLAANATKQFDDSVVWQDVKARSVNAIYKDILITNRYLVGRDGVKRPLFWKYVLPENTVKVFCEVWSDGNKQPLDDGYSVDLVKGVVYLEQPNYYDIDSGSYRLYLITAVSSDGTRQHTLANAVPAVTEATWEDVDPDTGLLKETSLCFVREDIGSGWKFTMPVADNWLYKPYRQAGIRPLAPQGKTSEQTWHPRFTVGELKVIVNGELRHYCVPEWNDLPFFPEKPYLHSPNQKGIYVNENTLWVGRNDIKVDPARGIDITITAWDQDGNLVKVLTTDSGKEGQYYRDTDLKYESDKISGWSEATGLVMTSLRILPEWDYYVEFYYVARDIELKSVELNPTINDQARYHTYVVYVMPSGATRLQWLKVDEEGVIVDCSDEAYKLRLSGAFNPDTIVGMKYRDGTVNCFTYLYTIEQTNAYQYYVLAEYNVLETDHIQDIFVADVRREGGTILPEYLESAFNANPKLLQSWHGYGEQGQEVPRNGAFIVRVPLDILEEYGGTFTQEQVERLLAERQTVGTHVVLDWYYPRTKLTGTSVTATEVELTCTWEGPSLTYRLYRAESKTAPWTEIATSVSPVEGTVSFTDTRTSDELWWYMVRIERNGVLFPPGNILGVRVA